ncbi:hypothetical protein [Mannheimia varigena]|uniref:hypothetical protein n=1 Tax=Mannheimia varigena TaxID=85404 RepID=UPI0015B4D2AB|nr:hypothetical protein [Mannheimia varigena]MDY2946927.1 hypothetical protein [Mannheimia varigena]QLD34147.1 hypothetical protein A6B42_10455 [Mannheimia varigena]
MKRYVLAGLFWASSHFASANETLTTLFECKTNKHQQLSLVLSGSTLNFMRQGEVEYQQDLSTTYLHAYVNGQQLMVPHNGNWYLFEETQATTGFTHVELVVRNAKTGRVMEFQECEREVNSVIALLSPEEIRLIPDDLSEWLFEVSNKYLP